MEKQVDDVEDLVASCAIGHLLVGQGCSIHSGSRQRQQKAWTVASVGMKSYRRKASDAAERALFWQSFVTAEVDTGTKSCAKSVLDPVFRVESDGGLGFYSISLPEAVG